MKNILIFKTASDVIMNRLFEELQMMEKSKKLCLVQTSVISDFQKKYPYVQFIDIRKEFFYGLDDSVINPLKEIAFEKIYIPTTRVRVNNYGNIVDICAKLSYQELVFYNCNGEQRIVKKKSRIEEMLIKLYISFVEMLHRK